MADTTLTLTGDGAANVTGNAAADSITGNNGNNAIDGGAGNDTVHFAGSYAADYILSTASNGTVTVASQVAGVETGTDTLTSVEHIDFANQHVLVVAPNGQYTTIQSAIDAASTGDLILITPGTYHESVDIDKQVFLLGNGSTADSITIDNGIDLTGSSGLTSASVTLDAAPAISDASGIQTALGFVTDGDMMHNGGTLHLNGSFTADATVTTARKITLAFNAGSSLSGSITGFANVDYSAVTGPLTLNLSTYTMVGNLIGSSASDTLVATSTATTFSVTGPDSGSVTAPSGSPSFTSIENLTGGTGNDSFVFPTGGSLSGSIVGGGGTNTLSYVGRSTTVSIDLQTSKATGIGGTFSGIGNYVGGDGTTGANDTLVGFDAGNVFNIITVNSGTITSGLATSTFSGIGNLTGGSSGDTFLFETLGHLTGSIDGAGAGNTLSYADTTTNVSVNLGTHATTGVDGTFANIGTFVGGTGSDTLTGTLMNPVTFTLSGVDAGTVSGGATATFSAFENLAGANGNDSLIGTSSNETFTLSGPFAGSVSGNVAFSGIKNVDGGGGSNTLVGTSLGTTYTVNGTNQGDLGSGSVTFANFRSLTGGTGNDTFDLSTGSLTGSIVGGGGSDTLSYATRSTSVAIDLGTGIATSIDGTFSSITSFIGGTSTDTLTGTSANPVTFTLTGVDAGTVSGGATATFSGFETLKGATSNDKLVGTSSDEIFTLTSPLSGSVTGNVSFVNIANLDGGSGNNTLVGTSTGTTYTVLGSNAGNLGSGSVTFAKFGNLTGGSGSDTFDLSAGSLTGSIVGGGGSDTLTYASDTTAVSVDLGHGTATNVGGTFSAIGTFVGGTASGNTLTGTNADDVFTLASAYAGTVTGGTTATFAGFQNLTGGSGVDKVVFTGTSADHTFTFGPGGLTVVDTRIGSPDGTHLLSGIENAAFGSQTVRIVGAGSSFTTIQSAVDASSTGDIVLIQAGTYAGAVNASNKSLAFTLGANDGVVLNNGDFKLDGTDSLAVRLDSLSSFDEFDVNGLLTLGGATLDLSVGAGYTPMLDDQFVIDRNDGTDAVVGQFSAGSRITVGSTTFEIGYQGVGAVDTNDVTLTVISAAVPTTTYVDSDWTGFGDGTVVTVAPGVHAVIGYDAFAAIQAGIDAVDGSAASPTVDVLTGAVTYAGNLTIAKNLTLQAFGAGTPSIVGTTGAGITVASGFAASITGLAVSGFTTDISVLGSATISSDTISGATRGVDLAGTTATSTVTGSTIFGNTTGVVFESGNGGTFGSNTFIGATANGTDLRLASGAGAVTLGGNKFAGSSKFIDDESTRNLDATGDTFAVGMSGAQVGGGSLSVAQAFAVEDGIVDVLDTAGLGYVKIVSGQVYVALSSETASTGAIQRGIGVAATSETVNVQAGSFADVDVNKTVTVLLAGNITVTSLSGVVAAQVGLQTFSLTVNPGSSPPTTTYLGSIGGASASSVVKAGSGTLVLAGTNTYAGPTTVSGGVLQLSGGAAIVDTADVSVTGGILNLATSETIHQLTLVSGSVTGTGNTLTDSADFLVQSGTVSANLAGAVGLTKSTAGSVTLTGANSYSGTTALSAGALVVNGTLAAGPVSVSSGATLAGTGTIGGTVTNAGTIAPALSPATGTLTVGSTSGTGTLSLAVNGTGTAFDQLSVVGTPTLTGMTLALSSTASLPVGNSVTIVANDGSDPTVGIFNSLPDGTIIPVGSNFFQIFYNFGTSNDVVLISVNATAPANVYANTAWSGFTAGQVILDADPGVSGSQAAIFGVNAFANLQDAIAASAVGADIVVQSGTFSAPFTVAKDVTLDLHNGTTTFSGAIDGSASLTKTGSSALVLAANDTAYVGTTTISQGVLQLGNNSTAGIVGGNIVDNATLTFNRSDSPTFAGAISGNGTVIKQGGGTLALTGTNSYFGGTNVSRGNLLISNDASLGDASGTVTVTTPGTLQFAGSVTTSRIIFLNNGSTLQVVSGTLTLDGAEIDGGAIIGPGKIVTSGAPTTFDGTHSTASLTINANVDATFINFSDGGVLNLAVGGTFSLNDFTVASSGTMTVDGTANVSDFVSNGVVTVDSGAMGGTVGGTISNVGTSSGLSFGGGSVTTIHGADATDEGNPPDNSGFINIGTVDASIAGGLMINDGFVGGLTIVGGMPVGTSATLNIGFGALVEGFGALRQHQGTERRQVLARPQSRRRLVQHLQRQQRQRVQVRYLRCHRHRRQPRRLGPRPGSSEPIRQPVAELLPVHDLQHRGRLPHGTRQHGCAGGQLQHESSFCMGVRQRRRGDHHRRANFATTNFNFNVTGFLLTSGLASSANFSVEFRDTDGDHVADSLFVVYTPTALATVNYSGTEDTPLVTGGAGNPAGVLAGFQDPTVAVTMVNGIAIGSGPITVANGTVSMNADGTFTYNPAPNFNGPTSFTYTVSDAGGKTTTGTVAITLTSVNDAPVGTSNTVTTPEDTTYVFHASDFGFTDPSDSPANHLLAVKISTLPAVGTLSDNGVAVTAGQFVPVADISGGLLVFAPAANANGAGYASLTFQVQDDGGTANSGVDTDPTARTMTINVTSVNDAPVGTSTTVTTPEDTAYVFSATDFGFTDPNDSPPNNLLAVKITTLPAAGTLSDNGVAVTAGQFVPVADINGGLLKFTPVANANGMAYASFTFQVQDDGGTANSGVDTDPTARTMTINVTSVNDAPIGTSTTVTTPEDTAYVFSATDFGFTDPSDSPANHLLAVKITTLPAVGTLTDNGVAVTAGQFVSVTDINSGLLKFTPVANANGMGYASFTFQVQDDGGTANSGVDTDPTAKTMTINVTSVNDAPVGTSNTITTPEDTAYVFSAADFGFTDPNDSPANHLLAVKITTLPAVGTLTDNGVAVTTGQFVPVADINGGLLKFTPVANANGMGYASFTFQVQDDGGTANSGVDTDPTAKTMTINVTSVNDAPVGTSTTVTTPEDTAYVFHASDFGFTDPSDSPANHLLAVKITTLPAVGTLTDNGVAVTPGQFVPVADINGGLLKFTPVANANGMAYASFTFQVQDDGGTANSGVDTDPTARTMTINVTSVNDAPVGTSNTVTTSEDTAYVFSATDFGFTDPSDSLANHLLAVKISTLPAAGTLSDNGVAVTAGQFISVADINGGLLKFTPVANANGMGYASFTFQVQDDGGTANSGVDTDPTAKTMTINVTSVNDAPVGTSTTVTTPEDTAYVFTASDFGFTDPSDSPANALLAVKITTLPAAGTLSDNGVAVTTGQFVPVADINGGLLKFAPAANANGMAYASFTFQVQDDGGTANSGVDTDPTAKTMTINVTSVNDAPVGTSNTVTTPEDTAYVFNASDFGFTDPSDSPANHLLAVKITTLPAVGTLTDNGVAVTTGQFVPVADINGGLLKFTPVANANGMTYASFTFQVQDDGGTANSGVDTDPTARTMTINVTSVNDAPVGTSNTVTTLEDTTYVFTASDFGFTDPSDSPANHLLAVKITTLPAAGTLSDNGVAVTTGQFVPVADINGGLLKFAPAANANGMAYASFTFQVQDDGGTANSGVDTDPNPKTMTINVTSVNDTPTITAATFSVPENSPVGTSVGSVVAADADVPHTLTYSITAGNSSGAFKIDATSGAVSVNDPYLLNFESTPTFNLTVTVTDDQNATASAAVTVNLTNVAEPNLQVNGTWTGPSFADGTTVVGSDGMNHIVGIDAFPTIAAAIDQADVSGTTIHIAAGTYTDALSLSKFVTLDTTGPVTISGAISGNDGLVKTGSSILVLTQTDTYSGGTSVKAGTLEVSSDDQLGVVDNMANAVTVQPGATIEYLASTSSSRQFNLNMNSTMSATLNVNGAGTTLTLIDAEVNGGMLAGTGAISTSTTASTFTGVTSMLRLSASLTIDATAGDTFMNFNNSGTMSLAAGPAAYTLSAFTNEANASLTINGTADVSDFEQDGTLVVSDGGELSNTGFSGLTFGGGSTTTVNGATTLNEGNPPMNSGLIDLGTFNATLSGLLVNDGFVGSISNPTIQTIDVFFGGLAEGYGSYAVTPDTQGMGSNHGKFSPGHSPGKDSVGTFVAGGGSSFQFEISDATGTAGSADGWDEVLVQNNVFVHSATIDFSAASAANPFNVDIVSLLNSGSHNTPGAADNFSPNQNYTWKFLDGSSGSTTFVGTFTPSEFNLNTSGFQNIVNGTFSIQQADAGKSLVIVYTAAANAPTPTIGSFTATPSTVTIGAPLTLTANNVSVSSGTIAGVNFYRESNGIPGLQIGSDTLVAAGTQSGANWSATSSTTGLAAASYTYYAVAADTVNDISVPSMATVLVTLGTATGAVETWNMAGQTGFGTQGLVANQVTGVSDSLGLTRGSGVTLSPPSDSNAWGANGWAMTSADGITGNQFVTFGLTVSAGEALSLSTINLNYHRSQSGPDSALWQYQIGTTGTWITIGDFSGAFNSDHTSISGASGTATLSLSGVSGLQNLAAGTTVDFRLVPYGTGVAAASTWYISHATSPDLAVIGTLSPGSSTTLVDNGPSPTTIGQTASFTVNVAGASPTGNVAIEDADNNNAIIASGSLSGGSASFTTSTLAAGTHHLFAVYAGDAANSASQSAIDVHTVQYVTGTTVSTNNASTVFGQDVALTATIAPTQTGLTGNVEFFDGGVSIGSATVGADGTATLHVTSLSVASHTITAVYDGDTTHVGSTSTGILQTVSTDNSSTGLGSSQEPSDFGETITLTATVTANSPGSGIPVGTVQFVIDSAPQGMPIAVDGTGKASISLSSLPIGPHVINATFTSGNSNFNGSVAVSITQDVNPSPTVAGIVLDGGSPYVDSSLAPNQHSMVESIVYTFSQAVSLSAADFSLAGINGTTLAPTVNVTAKNGTSRDTVWTVTFSGAGVNLATHSIADGEYQLVLSGVPGGLTNTYDFFRLLGDTDGNGLVNIADFSTLVGTFLRATNDPLYLGADDLDGDGTIGIADIDLLIGNYLHAVPTPLPN